MTCLILCHVVGSLNVYRFTDTGAYDLDAEIAYPNITSVRRWVIERQAVVDSLVERLSVNLGE